MINIAFGIAFVFLALILVSSLIGSDRLERFAVCGLTGMAIVLCLVLAFDLIVGGLV